MVVVVSIVVMIISIVVVRVSISVVVVEASSEGGSIVFGHPQSHHCHFSCHQHCCHHGLCRHAGGVPCWHVVVATLLVVLVIDSERLDGHNKLLRFGCTKRRILARGWRAQEVFLYPWYMDDRPRKIA